MEIKKHITVLVVPQGSVTRLILETDLIGTNSEQRFSAT
jgi:hypothetical protein